ncbi:UNVERIFIED_ORG: branched-chain amino acid transport system ATP-binding protein [Xanthobacter viscosus]|jgi:branched-chain amino acid transport system ATP-binding protein|uniref:ABC transporter ATP-binding protein n=1 Tax=Xanthobacter autotrophicus TaxID=280 RepID=A0A6C1KHY4_XANAU|nr:ABC transporter ATP-binding protein [Xanthobacter autotrophicus]TLX43421.1 ABC transporter ATP-binding protein [Xanthobacter autotrophicus]
MSVEPGIRPGAVEATVLLDIAGASIAYGKVRAVEGASLRVGAGEIVTVIGANGAGKSTLLNATMGALPLAAGTMTFLGRDVGRLAVEERVALGLSLVPERRELFSTMSVEDNLVLGGFRVARAVARDTLAEVYDRFPRLKERRRQLAGTMSGGERQMLAMGRALMGRPKLLMLDEPSLGLAPRIVADIFRIIADLRASGVSILLVEQNARAALAAADVAHVMELGTVTLSGPAAVLARDERVIESYLGFH